MHAIEPDMVLGKSVFDSHGGRLGEVVDVGLYTHSRVKFVLVEDKGRRVPIRRWAVDDISSVEPDAVTLRVQG